MGINYHVGRLRNEENISITCIAFHLIKKDSVLFADKEGYIGNFENILSANKSAENVTTKDPLMEVSIYHYSFICSSNAYSFCGYSQCV